MKEQLVVALTSWRKRIGNIPAVLDTIWSQTVQPDAVVLTLADEEFPEHVLPAEVQEYIDSHDRLVVNWVKHDTKVWKKFLLAFRLYPEALFMNIDDDMLYPPYIIERMLALHRKYPDAPISGNKYWRRGIKCHCGALSLVQPKHFEGWKKFYKHKFRILCQSSDMFYTRLAAANGYFYVDPDVDYIKELTPYNEVASYTASIPKNRLSASDDACYNRIGFEVVKMFSEQDHKPYCVFGSAQTELGRQIEAEMLAWLVPNFNVFVVRHNGSTFEYAAIKFLKDVMSRLGKPCFYVHTKGAYYPRKVSHRVRNMWKHEFVENQKRYLNAIRGKEAIVATPYTDGKITWYNGWVANATAIKEMELIQTSDRFFYEHELFENAKVKGLRRSDIIKAGEVVKFEDRSVMHADLRAYFD